MKWQNKRLYFFVLCLFACIIKCKKAEHKDALTITNYSDQTFTEIQVGCYQLDSLQQARPIEAARVQLIVLNTNIHPADSLIIRQDTSDEYGKLIFYSIEPGNYLIRARFDDQQQTDPLQLTQSTVVAFHDFYF